MTWSCCRAELGRGELGEPCPGWEGALGVRYCWVPLLCHSSATAVPLSCHCHCCAPLLPQLCHCPATAPRLSPLCRCPMVTAMVGWLLAHLPVPLLGSVVPRCAPWLCCSCSPGAVSCVQLCPPQSPHRAHPGDSSWTAGMEAGAAEGPLQIQVSECPCVGLSPSTPAASRAGRQNSSPTASPLQCQGSSFLRRCFTC